MSDSMGTLLVSCFGGFLLRCIEQMQKTDNVSAIDDAAACDGILGPLDSGLATHCHDAN